MSLKSKHITKKGSTNNKNTAVVSESVGNYEKHPFFIKKANAAKALLMKVGLPNTFSKKAQA